MEQINAGILKLMSNPGALVVGKKTDFGANREPSFDALLEQRNNQAGSEVVSDRSRKPDATEKETGGEKVSEKKPSDSEKSEEENYDLAREAIAGQIVWNVDPELNAKLADMKIPEKQQEWIVIEQPVIIENNSVLGSTLDGNAMNQIAGSVPVTGVETGEEILAETGTEALIEQPMEIVEEAGLAQLETNVSGQQAEETEIEIRVTGNENEDAGGEAAAADKPLFENVEAAPVKVAEAPERAEKAPRVEKQVAEKLVSVFESGETKVELRLDPAELGKLTIELTRNEDGTLNILLNAENVQTRGLLERHVTGLQEALAERGQQNVQITVDQSEESQRQDNNANQRNDFQDGSNGRQSEQHRRDDHRSGEDFLQQLRLGLIPIEEEDEED